MFTVTIPASSSPFKTIKSHMPSSLTLISRLSCRRAGTRFNARGIDDDGNVANSVETETVYWFPSGLSFSYAQVRGSVPLFWEQGAGLQQKIQITRSIEATQPAFNKHFEQLELNYGTIHILNLLSLSKAGEAEITERYNLHVRKCSQNQCNQGPEPTDRCLLQNSQFDFHAETKGSMGYEAANQIRQLIQQYVDGFAYFLSEEADEINTRGQGGSAPVLTSHVILQQEGVFRTNCLDCLDRTNLIQTIVSRMALELFFRDKGRLVTPDFWLRHSSIWADNGDVS